MSTTARRPQGSATLPPGHGTDPGASTRDSSVEMTLQAWTSSDDYWQAKADVLQAAKEALDAAGIEIPFPHQVAVPYRDDQDADAPTPANSARSRASDPSPGDAHQDSGSEG